MVQTCLGAKSNPWIVYMKACRAHYNSVRESTAGAVEPLSCDGEGLLPPTCLGDLLCHRAPEPPPKRMRRMKQADETDEAKVAKVTNKKDSHRGTATQDFLPPTE